LEIKGQVFGLFHQNEGMGAYFTAMQTRNKLALNQKKGWNAKSKFFGRSYPVVP